MRTRVLVAAAAFVIAGGIVGCDRTTPGAVSMTTEAGSSGSGSTSIRPSTSSTRTSSPSATSSTPRTSSNVPPPADSLSMTCEEYLKLDTDTRDAALSEILAQSNGFFDPSQQDVAKLLVDSSCPFLPEAVVADLLTGASPP